MAWNLKYYGQWYDFGKSDPDFCERVEVYVQTSATPQEVTISGFKYTRPSFDLFSDKECLIGEGVDMALISNQPLDFLDIFYTINPTGVQVRYYQNYYIPDGVSNSPTFTGYIDAEQYNDPISKQLNYKINITANNGFPVLDRFPLLDSNNDQLSGLWSLIDVIKFCLDKLGISYDTLNLGLYTKVRKWSVSAPTSVYENYYSDANSSTGVFHECLINMDNFYDEEGSEMTCREVLSAILLPFGARLFAFDNNIYILDLHNLANSSIYVKSYSYTDLTYQGVESIDPVLKTIDQRLEDHSVEMVPGKRKVTINFNKYVENNPREIEISNDTMSSFLSQVNYVKDGDDDVKYKEFRYASCENFEKILNYAGTSFVRREVPSSDGSSQNAEYFMRIQPDTDSPAYWAVQINTGIYVYSSNLQFIGMSGKVMFENISDYMKESDMTSLGYSSITIRLCVQQTKTGIYSTLINDFYYDRYTDAGYWQEGKVIADADSGNQKVPFISFKEYNGNLQYNKWYEINGGSGNLALWPPGVDPVFYQSPIWPLKNWSQNVSKSVKGGYLFLQIFSPEEGTTIWQLENYLGYAIKDLKIHLLEQKGNDLEQFKNVEPKDAQHQATSGFTFIEELNIDTIIGTDLKTPCRGALYMDKGYRAAETDLYYDCAPDGYEIEHARIVRIKYFNRGDNEGYLEDLLLNTYLTNLQQTRYRFIVNLRGFFKPWQLFEFELLQKDGVNVRLFPVSMEYDAVNDRTQFTLEEIQQEEQNALIL